MNTQFSEWQLQPSSKCRREVALASYVAKALKRQAADLSVQQPTTFEMAINLKAAKLPGLAVPPLLLAGPTR